MPTTFEEMLNSRGYIVYACKGTSMLPLLRQKKDIVEIHSISYRPKKYDVVLYKRNNQYILHRILHVFPTYYIIAGDHNAFIETDVTDDMILGVMTRIIRNGRNIYPTDWQYRFYVHLWCDFFPLRAAILYMKQKATAVLQRLIPRKEKDYNGDGDE